MVRLFKAGVRCYVFRFSLYKDELFICFHIGKSSIIVKKKKKPWTYLFAKWSAYLLKEVKILCHFCQTHVLSNHHSSLFTLFACYGKLPKFWCMMFQFCWWFYALMTFGYQVFFFFEMFMKLSNNIEFLEYGMHRKTKRSWTQLLLVHELTSTKVISKSPPRLIRRSSWIGSEPSNLYLFCTGLFITRLRIHEN